jgi:hypothetical protein
VKRWKARRCWSGCAAAQTLVGAYSRSHPTRRRETRKLCNPGPACFFPFPGPIYAASGLFNLTLPWSQTPPRDDTYNRAVVHECHNSGSALIVQKPEYGGSALSRMTTR